MRCIYWFPASDNNINIIIIIRLPGNELNSGRKPTQLSTTKEKFIALLLMQLRINWLSVMGWHCPSYFTLVAETSTFRDCKRKFIFYNSCWCCHRNLPDCKTRTRSRTIYPVEGRKCPERDINLDSSSQQLNPIR